MGTRVAVLTSSSAASSSRTEPSVSDVFPVTEGNTPVAEQFVGRRFDRCRRFVVAGDERTEYVPDDVRPGRVGDDAREGPDFDAALTCARRVEPQTRQRVATSVEYLGFARSQSEFDRVACLRRRLTPTWLLSRS